MLLCISFEAATKRNFLNHFIFSEQQRKHASSAEVDGWSYGEFTELP